jgi:hypothetical protein
VISDVEALLGGGGMGGGGALHRIGDTNHDGISESTVPALCICGNLHIARDRATDGQCTRCVLHISMVKQSLRCDRCSSVMTTEFGRGRRGMGSRAGDGVWVRVDDLQRR